jgi:hypothetical protein
VAVRIEKINLIKSQSVEMASEIMTREDYLTWEAFRKDPKTSITNEEYEMVSRLHSVYFKHQYFKPCTCNAKTIQTWIENLNELFLKQ